MSNSRVVVLAVIVGVLVVQADGRSQGLLRNQLAGMVEQSVAGVQFATQPGFVIERVTPATRTDSYIVITFDSRGRLVVSKENDTPRMLLDDDGDGVHEAEKVIAERVRNCQGLWFDGPTLYGACAEAPASAAPTAPGPQGRGNPPTPPAGIFRMTDTNGDDVTDTFEMLARMGRIQEHGPHAIRRAPDGRIMVLVGNNETIPDAALDLTSPVLRDRDGQFLPALPGQGASRREGAHSALFAWHEPTRTFAVFSGGNRNAYDFAFNLSGEAFLFDSDNEADIGTPWYREVRTVHQISNGNYGYRNSSGKYPAYYLDSLPPVRDVGRGSPVGVETYSSYAYPREYFENLFEADWSRGRLLFTTLTPSGATFTARPDPAEFVHGEPLNITDVETGPDGLLYFTTGGRNTAGGVWRLRYTGTAPAHPDRRGILAVVRQPQPLSSWGWQAIEAVRASMTVASFGAQLERLARDTSADGMDRARAIYEMQRHGPAPSTALLGVLVNDRDAAVRAAVVYVAGVQGEIATSDTAAIAAAGLRDRDPIVKRRAAEALVGMGQSPDRPSLAPVDDVLALLNHPDRFVRWSGRILVEHTPRADWKDRVLAETNPLGAMEGMLAWVRTAGSESLQPILEKQFALLKQTRLSVDHRLRLYRAFMYTTTEIPSGLSAADRRRLHDLIAGHFPAADERVNRELALMLAYAGQTEGIDELLAAMPVGNDNQPLQLHYLYALRTVRQGWTPAQKAAAADVLGRSSRWRGGSRFAEFLAAIYDPLAELYATDAERQVLHTRAPDFAPLAPGETTTAPARGGRAGGNPVAARTRGRVLNKGEIFDDVIYTPRTDRPAPEAGRAIFEARCASCHRMGRVGTDHGVRALNLTSLAPTGERRALLESIMFPSRRIAAAQESTAIVASDGRTITGLVVREDAGAVVLLTADGITVEIGKPVRSRRRDGTTIMTDVLTDTMSQAELSALLAFLQAP
jgi:putative heme-binding domain-containing protein